MDDRIDSKLELDIKAFLDGVTAFDQTGDSQQMAGSKATDDDSARQFASDQKVHNRSPTAADYKLCPAEVGGEVFDWVFNYLNEKKCPYSLAVKLALIVAQKLGSETAAAASGGRQLIEEYVTASPSNSLGGVKLQKQSIEYLNEICAKLKTNQSEAFVLGGDFSFSPFVTSSYAIKNTRRKMEDRHVILHDLNKMYDLQTKKQYSYYAVFDGHAGVEAATYAAAHLHENLINGQAFAYGEIAAAFREAFSVTDLYYLQRAAREGLKSGSTALCCLLEDKKKLYVAWLGDSSAILVKSGKPYDIMTPHKPERQDERLRIEELGGFVVCVDTWRVNGTLAVSRALGDPEHKPYVSSDPDVNEIVFDGEEDFIILGCDGLWDQVTPEEATTTVYQFLKEAGSNASVDELADQVAQALVKNAKDEGSTDNITTIVIFLRSIEEILSQPFNPPSPRERVLPLVKEENSFNNGLEVVFDSAFEPETMIAQTNGSVTNYDFLENSATNQSEPCVQVRFDHDSGDDESNLSDEVIKYDDDRINYNYEGSPNSNRANVILEESEEIIDLVKEVSHEAKTVDFVEEDSPEAKRVDLAEEESHEAETIDVVDNVLIEVKPEINQTCERQGVKEVAFGTNDVVDVKVDEVLRDLDKTVESYSSLSNASVQNVSDVTSSSQDHFESFVETTIESVSETTHEVSYEPPIMEFTVPSHLETVVDEVAIGHPNMEMSESHFNDFLESNLDENEITQRLVPSSDSNLDEIEIAQPIVPSLESNLDEVQHPHVPSPIEVAFNDDEIQMKPDTSDIGNPFGDDDPFSTYCSDSQANIEVVTNPFETEEIPFALEANSSSTKVVPDENLFFDNEVIVDDEANRRISSDAFPDISMEQEFSFDSNEKEIEINQQPVMEAEIESISEKTNALSLSENLLEDFGSVQENKEQISSSVHFVEEVTQHKIIDDMEIVDEEIDPALPTDINLAEKSFMSYEQIADTSFDFVNISSDTSAILSNTQNHFELSNRETVFQISTTVTVNETEKVEGITLALDSELVEDKQEEKEVKKEQVVKPIEAGISGKKPEPVATKKTTTSPTKQGLVKKLDTKTTSTCKVTTKPAATVQKSSASKAPIASKTGVVAFAKKTSATAKATEVPKAKAETVPKPKTAAPAKTLATKAPTTAATKALPSATGVAKKTTVPPKNPSTSLKTATAATTTTTTTTTTKRLVTSATSRVGVAAKTATSTTKPSAATNGKPPVATTRAPVSKTVLNKVDPKPKPLAEIKKIAPKPAASATASRTATGTAKPTAANPIKRTTLPPAGRLATKGKSPATAASPSTTKMSGSKEAKSIPRSGNASKAAAAAAATEEKTPATNGTGKMTTDSKPFQPKPLKQELEDAIEQEMNGHNGHDESIESKLVSN